MASVKQNEMLDDLQLHNTASMGNNVMTKKQLRKNWSNQSVTTEILECLCGWINESKSMRDTKLKERLHKKVCPLEKK